MQPGGSDSGNPFRRQLPSINAGVFPLMLDTLQESLFLMNNEFKLVWHNEACNKLYHSVSGKYLDTSFDFNELLTAKQQPLFREYLNKTLAGEPSDFEWYYKSSISKWLCVSLYPFTDNNGFIGICGSLRDITERKINEQVLLRNTAVLNNIDEGILLVDADSNLLAYNRKAFAFLRRINVDLQIGINFINHLPLHRRVPAFKYLELALTGMPVEYEVVYPSDTWFLINFKPVKNDKGDIKQVSITFRDITERKKSEEHIKSQEKKYRTVVNSLSEGVVLLSPDKKILAVNQSAQLILGLTADELMQHGVRNTGWRFTDENEKEIIPFDFFNKKNTEVIPLKNKTICIQKKNGIQWLRLNAVCVNETTSDEAVAFVISFQDITNQRRISAEMKVLSMVARETLNAVLILQLNGEVLWVNEGFTRLTGYASDEIIGTVSREMLFGPDTDMTVINEMRIAREKGLPFRGEQMIYTRDRRKVYTRVEGQALKNDNGEVSGMFVIVTDITEEKKIMQEMEVLSMVAKETSNGIMIFDKTSTSTLWVNEGFTRLTGFKPDDIIGRNPVSVLQGPETNQEVLKNMAWQIQNNLSYSGDILIYAKDGSKRLHHVMGQPFRDKNGQVNKYFAISTDITERRRLEEERLQKEVEQQKEITRVILQTQETERNELGRELHDNINQILSAVSLQLSYYLSNEGEIQKPFLANIYDNVKEVMNEIRKLSHQMVMPRFLDVDLADRLNKLLGNYNYNLAAHLDTTGWNDNIVPVDVKETFFRIAQEQLSNIYKHAQADKIMIHIKNCSEYALMSITDNGIGFDPAWKKTGIGIANITNRVELYGGRVELISAPGKGCILSVSIPLIET